MSAWGPTSSHTFITHLGVIEPHRRKQGLSLTCARLQIQLPLKPDVGGRQVTTGAEVGTKFTPSVIPGLTIIPRLSSPGICFALRRPALACALRLHGTSRGLRRMARAAVGSADMEFQHLQSVHQARRDHITCRTKGFSVFWPSISSQ